MINQFLSRYPKLNMSVLPTPIHKLSRISEICNTEIYCMRDDLTGFAFGGNKTRKLDFLVADALKTGFDTLIGIGANQSNFCRMTAGAGKANNLDVQLVLSGKKPEKLTGNLLVDKLFGATIHHIDTEDDSLLLEEAANLEKKLTSEGKKVYNMPLGGSTNIGALGYINAFQEILDFSEKTKIIFNTIILASGSGGTQAGLNAGKIISNSHHKIIGISVGRAKQELEDINFEIIRKTFHGTDFKAIKDVINVDDSYIGEGYGKRTDGCIEAVSQFAKLEGILLDYVYTGKAAAGLFDYAIKEKFNNNENVLFIHTGGNIELFE